jgi:hypothetical protein
MNQLKNRIYLLSVLILLDLIILLILSFLPIDNFQLISSVYLEGNYYLKISKPEDVYYFHNGQMIEVTMLEKRNEYFLVRTPFISKSLINFYQLTGTESLLEHLLQVFR